jgi:hypothetical protein
MEPTLLDSRPVDADAMLLRLLALGTADLRKGARIVDLELDPTLFEAPRSELTLALLEVRDAAPVERV